MYNACGTGSERGPAGRREFISQKDGHLRQDKGRPVAERLPPCFRDHGSQLEVAAGVSCSADSRPISSLSKEGGLGGESSGTGMKGQTGGWGPEGKFEGNSSKEESS